MELVDLDSSQPTHTRNLQPLHSLIEALQCEKTTGLLNVDGGSARFDGIHGLQELSCALPSFPSSDTSFTKLFELFDDRFRLQTLNCKTVERVILTCALWAIQNADSHTRLLATQVVEDSLIFLFDSHTIFIDSHIVELVTSMLENMRYADADYLSMKEEIIIDLAVLERLKILRRAHPSVIDPENPEAKAYGDDWTLRKASAALLDKLAHTIQRERVVELVLSFTEAGLRDSSWDKREVAVLAVGAIAATDSLLPATVLQRIVGSCREAQHPLERSMCCWAMGRYATRVSAMQWEEECALNKTIAALLASVVDGVSIVRNAACTALCEFFENCCTSDMLPYVQDIINTVAGAAEIYSGLDLSMLADMADTFATSMAGSFATGPDGDALLRPWLSMLSKSLDDKALMSIFQAIRSFAEKGSDLLFKEASMVIRRIHRVVSNYFSDVLEQRKRPAAAMLDSSGCTVDIYMMNGRRLAPVRIHPDESIAAFRSLVSTGSLNGRPCSLLLGDAFLRDASTIAKSGISDGACVTAVLVQTDSAVAEALNFFDSMVEGFGTRFEECLSPEEFEGLLTLFKRCFKAPSCEVRQAGFAIVGTLLTYNLYIPQLCAVLPACSQGLSDEESDVCNNASWSIGMACKQMTPAELFPHVEEISSSLSQAYKSEFLNSRGLRDCLEETLRRFGGAPERFHSLVVEGHQAVVSTDEPQKSSLREGFTGVFAHCKSSFLASESWHETYQLLSLELRSEFRLCDAEPFG